MVTQMSESAHFLHSVLCGWRLLDICLRTRVDTSEHTSETQSVVIANGVIPLVHCANSDAIFDHAIFPIIRVTKFAFEKPSDLDISAEWL